MRGLTRDTFGELVDRKIIWVFAFLTLIGIGLIVIGDMAAENFGQQAGAAIGEEADAKPLVEGFLAGFLDDFLGFVLLIAVFGTAGLIPRMLEKGRAEYYLAQPISRTGLLLGKVFGTWLVYGGIVIVVGLVLIATVAVVIGVSNAGVIYVFADKLYAYFIWLSVSAFIGIVSGSTAVTIITQFAIWIGQGLLVQRELLYGVVNSKVVEYIGDAVYYILPKFSEISGVTIALANDTPVESWQPVWSSGLFGVGLIVLSLYLFRRKDY